MTDTAYIRLSPLQRVEIEEALDDVERTETSLSKISFDDLAQLFGVGDV